MRAVGGSGSSKSNKFDCVFLFLTEVNKKAFILQHLGDKNLSTPTSSRLWHRPSHQALPVLTVLGGLSEVGVRGLQVHLSVQVPQLPDLLQHPLRLAPIR